MANTQTKKELKPYKEVLEKNLYSVDYEDETKDGNKYPKNRIKVDLISYSWEVEVNGEVREYEWMKIVLTNSKLQIQDWQNVIKQKSLKTPYGERIVNDETKVKISIDEWDWILEHFKNLAGTIPKPVKTYLKPIQKTQPKKEEEISIEDITF